MHNRHQGEIPYLPASLPCPQAEIRLLTVEEEPLVHHADPEKNFPPGDQERPGHPVAALLLVVSAERQVSLAQPGRARREPLEANRVAEGPSALGKRRIVGATRPVRGELAHSCHSDSRTRVKGADELFERAVENPCIDIEKEVVASVTGRERLVVRMCETAVFASQ